MVFGERFPTPLNYHHGDSDGSDKGRRAERDLFECSLVNYREARYAFGKPWTITSPIIKT